MKRFLLFFMSTVLTAIFLMPATVQAKKIKYGKKLYIEGTNNGSTFEGTLFCGEKPLFTGVFQETPTTYFDKLVSYGKIKTTINGNEFFFEGTVKWCKSNGYEKDRFGYLISAETEKGKIHYGDNKSCQGGVTFGVGDGFCVVKSAHLSYWEKDSVPYDNLKWDYDMQYHRIDFINGALPIKAFKHYDMRGSDKIENDTTCVEFENGAQVFYKADDGEIRMITAIKYPNGDFYTDLSHSAGLYGEGVCLKSFVDGTIYCNNTEFNYVYADKKGNKIPIDIHNKQHIVIQYSDGSKYEGSISIETDEALQIGRMLKKVFEVTSIRDIGLKYRDGIFKYPDGTEMPYINGKSRAEVEKQITQNRKARLAREKEERDRYNALCNQYGKKYIDAALSRLPIIGMPEKLVTEYLTNNIELDMNNFRVYEMRRPKPMYIVGNPSADVYRIRVSNGKVVSISRYEAWYN